jgi:predicted glycoside hydrolase/deacetylase ChbG (UPF0249 family)
MKHIILCADDYGQNSAISQAIVELLKEKHISATSCLTTSPYWPSQAKWLEPFKQTADIGLHFNLTEGKPLSSDLSGFWSLKNLMIQSNLRQINQKIIKAELRAQIDQFVNSFGQLPDFIDGHQHVHQFPIIRDAVIETFDELLRENSSYLRCTYDPKTLFRFNDVNYFKQLVIQLSGGIAFKRLVTSRNIPHNQSFAGIYNFADSYSYAELFPRFLNQAEDGGIILCHPALMSSEENEEMATSRHNEYLYFSGPKYSHDRLNNQFKLARFRDFAQHKILE